MASELGNRIRELRTDHGWSQSQLAEFVNQLTNGGAEANLVSRWERGARKPRPRTLAALATVFQVPCAMLEDVDRRRLLTDVAGVAVAPAVASDLLAHGFRAILRTGPTMDQWQGSVEQYGADYMTEGAATIQQRLAGDLITL